MALRERLAVSLGVLRPPDPQACARQLKSARERGGYREWWSTPILVGCAPSSTRTREPAGRGSRQRRKWKTQVPSTSLPRAPPGGNWLRWWVEELGDSGLAGRRAVGTVDRIVGGARVERAKPLATLATLAVGSPDARFATVCGKELRIAARLRGAQPAYPSSAALNTSQSGIPCSRARRAQSSYSGARLRRPSGRRASLTRTAP